MNNDLEVAHLRDGSSSIVRLVKWFLEIGSLKCFQNDPCSKTIP